MSCVHVTWMLKLIIDLKNVMKLCMVMYPDHFQNFLDFGYGLLNFLILASFWISKTVIFRGCGDFLQNALEEGFEFDRRCIPTTFSTTFIFVMVCWLSAFWLYFDLVKQVRYAVFRHFLQNAYEELAELILRYPKKWKRQNSAYKINPVTKRGIPDCCVVRLL